MKRFLKVMLSIVALSVVGFFIAFAITGFDLDNFPEAFYASADSEFTEMTADFSLEGINEISVSGKSERIVLSNTDGDQISIKYFVSEDKATDVKNENGKISLTTSLKHRIFNFKIQTKKTDYIEIKLPKSFDGALDLGTTSSKITATATNTLSRIRLASTSGNVVANGITSLGDSEFKSSSARVELNNCDLTAGQAVVKTTSGGISINGCSFSDAEIQTSSANINIRSSTFDTASFDNRSGSIKLYDVVAGEISAVSSSDRLVFDNVIADNVYGKTSSGSIKVTNGVFGVADFKSSSDNISLSGITCDNITAQTSSGSITMTVKGSFDDYKMDVKTSSGNIRIDGQKYYTMIVNPTAEKYIYAHTSSDNIRISFI